ncbi:hypothetical protein pb186bvf_014431 [Paramecium bursaria]
MFRIFKIQSNILIQINNFILLQSKINMKQYESLFCLLKPSEQRDFWVNKISHKVLKLESKQRQFLKTELLISSNLGLIVQSVRFPKEFVYNTPESIP